MSMQNAGVLSPRTRGVHDATLSYDRLNIVSSGNVSYIARCNVPANTLITNTTYWMPLVIDPATLIDGTSLTVDQNGIIHVTIDSSLSSTSTNPVQNSVVKAAIDATHNASNITSGTIDIERLPQGALERLVHVQDQAARYSLTANDVQLGDTVKQDDTGVMYIVVNMLALDSALGYEEYTAGSATSVPWSGIINKPESYTPASHIHTISDLTNLNNAVHQQELSIPVGSFANQNTISFTITGASTLNGIITPAAGSTLAQLNAIKYAMFIVSISQDTVTVTLNGVAPTIAVSLMATWFNG